MIPAADRTFLRGQSLGAGLFLAGIREEARKRGWELQTLTEEAEAAEEPVLLVGGACSAG